MPKEKSEIVEQEIPLSEMIETLRAELQQAQAASADSNSDIVFETDKVELELQVALSRTAKGEGGVEFWVVKAGGEYEKSVTTTHTFKISLTPMQKASGKRLRVAKKTGKSLAKG